MWGDALHDRGGRISANLPVQANLLRRAGTSGTPTK